MRIKKYHILKNINMKKFSLIFACFAIVLCANASDKLSFGVKAEFNFTNFWGVGCLHTMKPGYQAGFFAEYKVCPKFAIAPELIFSAQ